MQLSAAMRLGPYEILAPIGAGGMGEVYKARDTRLDRVVAIKVSAEGFGERFHREAKAIASLNHPHICTLHDVGKEGGVEYLVMEYIDGKPLRGPMPVNEVIRLGAQIADALDTAHSKGVTHRDLKPANVLLTKGGVKVLDFGLAKVADAPRSENESTMTDPPTAEGQILGTLPYMAPEQVEGRKADARSDLWALGLLLYEMATGKRAFAGKTTASLVASIMTSEPPALGRLGPPNLEWVVRQCLAKDPDDRWQSARDLRQSLLREMTVPSPVPSRRAWAWGIAGLVAGLLVAVGAWVLRPGPDSPMMHLSVRAPEGATLTTHGFDLSPDGRQIVFTATQGGVRKLWLRGLDSDNAKPLEGTEGAWMPAWSPDGKSIAFFTPGKLKRLDTAGGPLRVISNAAYGKGVAWSSSGVLLFSPRNGVNLYRVSASGEGPEAATVLDRAAGEMEHAYPQFLPDGKQFLYHSRNADPRKSGLMLGRLEESGPTKPRRLLNTEARAIFVRGGHGGQYLLYVKDSTLMAQGFEASNGKLTGETLATPVTGLAPQSSLAGFVTVAGSSSGLIAYQTGTTGSQLSWMNRVGKTVTNFGTASEYISPRLSPDGKRLLVAQSGEMGKLQLWLIDIDPPRATRLTFGVRDFYAIWSNDGREFIYTSSATGQPNLYKQAVAGGNQSVALGPSPNPQYAADWSRDGDYVIYVGLESIASTDLLVWPLKDRRSPFTFLGTSAAEMHGQFSPESSGPPKWVLYTSDESGVDQIYAHAFRGEPASGSKIQVTTAGGRQPRWRGDGKELFYVSPDNKIMAMPVVETAKGLEFGTPVVLFEARLQVAAQVRYGYDVTRDGKNFVLVTELESQFSNHINVLVNWENGLRR